jgi:hypothetical protein
MNARTVLVTAAATAATVLATAEIAARVMLRPWPVPAEIAAGVANLEADGFRDAGFCPRRCPYSGRVHVHMLTPGGKPVTVGPEHRDPAHVRML